MLKKNLFCVKFNREPIAGRFPKNSDKNHQGDKSKTAPEGAVAERKAGIS